MNKKHFSISLFVFIIVGLILSASGSMADTIEVQLFNFSFSPNNLTITVGDTVRWINKTSTFHTTTSGTDCVANGTWDANLSSFNSSFIFEFTSAGTFPYFCRPHCGLGMTGSVTVEEATGITPGLVSSGIILNQNFPNPFNPSTTITYLLPQEIQVNLSIYTVDGKLVKTLVSGTQASGRKVSTWNGTNSRGEVVGSGVYFYSLKANDELKTRKMIFMK